jgi:integrase/recombinase XerD
VTCLRKMMLEELQRRNYAETTIDCYIRAVEDFSRRFHLPPDGLGPRHIREYQAELFQKQKLATPTVRQRLAALRFFYIKTLKKAWSLEETPYPKTTRRSPTILSQEEVARLIDAARLPLHRTLLMALYATGLRRAELARLKVSDINSQRMVIHVRGGKGRKDRDVMLSPMLLDELRQHWRRLRRKPSEWLFPSGHARASDQPITLTTENLIEGVAASPRTPRAFRSNKPTSSFLKVNFQFFFEGHLPCLQRSRPARRPPESHLPAHAAPLFRHASARSRRGSAHHSDPVRP